MAAAQSHAERRAAVLVANPSVDGLLHSVHAKQFDVM